MNTPAAHGTLAGCAPRATWHSTVSPKAAQATDVKGWVSICGMTDFLAFAAQERQMPWCLRHSCLKCCYCNPDTFIQKTKKLFQDTRSQRNMAALTADLAEVHTIMSRNIAEVLGQGEKLDSKCGQQYLHQSERIVCMHIVH